MGLMRLQLSQDRKKRLSDPGFVAGDWLLRPERANGQLVRLIRHGQVNARRLGDYGRPQQSRDGMEFVVEGNNNRRMGVARTLLHVGSL